MLKQSHKQLLFFSLLIIPLLLLQACQKKEERLDDYWINFATVLKSNSEIRFQLDNKKILIPKELKDYKGNNDQRVIINYSLLRGDTIKVNGVSDIFTGDINLTNYTPDYKSDPVNVQSVWVGGNYLNMIIEIDYFDTPHSIDLLKSPSTTNELYFSHSKNNDPPGYPVLMYVSFSLRKLRNQNSNTPIPFTVYINTYEGLRTFHLITSRYQ